MTKRFDIHEWQAKQRLVEQDEFQKRQDRLTPGKNPDEFYGDGSLDKLRNSDAFGSAGTDKRTGQVIGDILQLIKSTGIDPEEVIEAIKMSDNFMKEMNTTGTGASFNAGAGEGYASPNAFKKKKKNKED
tara:strand:+ start:73 stop:462 length:390 start_codon:yes stop_codon:yes gene_type:complete